MSDFTRDEIMDEVKALHREVLKAEAMVYGLHDGVEKLKMAFIDDVLEDAEISEGDKCVIHFSDGDMLVEFVEAMYGRIHVKRFGSKGKLNKGVTTYDYTVSELFEKIGDRDERDDDEHGLD